jgi:hypothetical protein
VVFGSLPIRFKSGFPYPFKHLTSIGRKWHDVGSVGSYSKLKVIWVPTTLKTPSQQKDNIIE